MVIRVFETAEAAKRQIDLNFCSSSSVISPKGARSEDTNDVHVPLMFDSL